MQLLHPRPHLVSRSSIARLGIPGAILFAAAVATPWVLLAPSAPPNPIPLVDEVVLARALEQARDDCFVATLMVMRKGPPPGAPLFKTSALECALDTDLVEENAYGELPAIRRELRWLATLQADTPLEDRSWEDVRFLLGAIHWYLEMALARVEPEPALELGHQLPLPVYSQRKLRVFRGLSFEDMLGLWD